MFSKWFLLLSTITLSLLIAGICPKELTLEEFDELLKDDRYLVVFYYSPSCLHCTKIKPVWELFETQVLEHNKPDDKLFVGQVDCETERSLCSREEIEEIPTIKLYFSVNYLTRVEYTYPSDKKIDIKSLKEFVNSKLDKSSHVGVVGDNEDGAFGDEEHSPIHDFQFAKYSVFKTEQLIPVNNLFELKDSFIEMFLRTGEHFVNFYAPWCKYCKSLEPIWEQLAQSLDTSLVRLSKVDCTQNVHSCKLFNIKEYPTLLWISNGKIIARYKGLHTLTNLKNFINTQMVDYEFRKSSNSFDDGDSFEAELLGQHKHSGNGPMTIGNDNFSKTIATGFTFVHFTVPWSKQCMEMSPEWKKLAKKVSEKNLAAKIARVDCASNEKLCNDEHIDSYPTLHLYSGGYRHQEFTGDRTLESFIKYLEPFLHFKDEL